VRGPRRDHVIAASLAGAVVVVVGYASGIGLHTATTATPVPPPLAQVPQPSTPPAEQPPAAMPSDVRPAPLPAAAVGYPQQPPDTMPPMPGGVDVDPTTEPAPPTTTMPTPTTPPPPPETGVPACQPAVAQQVLDTVGGLPLIGSVTGGLGVTGPDGLTATILGYCRAADGTLTPVPVQSGR